MLDKQKQQQEIRDVVLLWARFPFFHLLSSYMGGIRVMKRPQKWSHDISEEIWNV